MACRFFLDEYGFIVEEKSNCWGVHFSGWKSHDDLIANMEPIPFKPSINQPDFVINGYCRVAARFRLGHHFTDVWLETGRLNLDKSIVSGGLRINRGEFSPVSASDNNSYTMVRY